MLVYCAAGFSVYCLLLFMELLQKMHLNRIDAQLEALDRQVNAGGEF